MAWFSAQVVAAPTRSVSQHHPAVQGHGHGAIQLILAGIAVVPASHNVICSAISACFCRAADSPRTVVAEQVRRGLSRHQRRSLHSRDSSRPNVLCVQTAHRPRFSRTVRVSCFCRTANAVGRWIGVPPRDNCEPFGIAASVAILSSTASCLGSDATFPAVDGCVLAVSNDVSVTIAGRCCRRLHTLRFVRMPSPSSRSPGDRPSWRRST